MSVIVLSPDPADGGVHYFTGNYAISGSNGSEELAARAVGNEK